MTDLASALEVRTALHHSPPNNLDRIYLLHPGFYLNSTLRTRLAMASSKVAAKEVSRPIAPGSSNPPVGTWDDFHVLISAANGEQDQGVSFRGPSPSEEKAAADAKDAQVKSAIPAQAPVDKPLAKESWKNIGNRRRSSASNQPSVNLRRGMRFVDGS